MPRINVTDEELRALEKIRTKQAQTLGYNEGLEIAAIQIETIDMPLLTSPNARAELAQRFRALKRDLPL